MKKILMLSNTYFQLIIAINLKLTEFKDDYVDLFITDTSSDCERISANLKKLNLFNNVHIIRNSNILQSGVCGLKVKLKKIIDFQLLKNKTYEKFDELVPLRYYDYDLVLFYNYSFFVIYLFEKIYQENIKVKCSRFEEGFISYFFDIDSPIVQYNQKINKLLGRNIIRNALDSYYFFNPEFVLFNHENYKLKELRALNRFNQELKLALNAVFGYDFLTETYDKKYIFFEESFFCDKKGIEDYNLILKVSEIVGKDNLMVKLHPRNPVDRFAKYGITTNKTVGIPWEIIQLNNDFSKHIFLTISSGSVLASRLYFNDNIKTYLLYNCTDKMSDVVDDDYREYLSRIEKKFGINNFVIPQNTEQFLILLRQDCLTDNILI